nr:MAG TPA: baseplate protein [Caudoviricetes sp.]
MMGKLTKRDALADMIRVNFLNKEPDDQEFVLEYEDWSLILDALSSPEYQHIGYVDQIDISDARTLGMGRLLGTPKANRRPVFIQSETNASDCILDLILSDTSPMTEQDKLDVEKFNQIIERAARGKDTEYRCPKCGVQADERFDCCEVFAALTPENGGENHG